MRKPRTAFMLFLQLAALIIFPAYTAYAESADTQGTYYISLTLNPSTGSVLSIKGHERHYAVKGNAVLTESNDADAFPNIYLTYQSKCVFDPHTMEARESTSFLMPGTGKKYTLDTKMKCSSDPGISQHATCTIQSTTGTPLKKSKGCIPNRRRHLYKNRKSS